MAFPGISKHQGHDFNYFQKKVVNWTQFGALDGYTADGYGPDLIIPFSTQAAIFLNEGTGIIEYSFNGTTVHGELDGSVSSLTKMLTFNSRVISLIWFRVKAGSTSSTVSVQAWGIR